MMMPMLLSAMGLLFDGHTSVSAFQSTRCMPVCQWEPAWILIGNIIWKALSRSLISGYHRRRRKEQRGGSQDECADAGGGRVGRHAWTRPLAPAEFGPLTAGGGSGAVGRCV